MTWLFSKAMMEDYGNSHSSPEPVEEYSADTCSDGEPSAQLNVMPTPHKFWRNDKTMEFSRLSQFGLTLRLLTESHGEAVLMSYLAAFPARTLAQLVPAPVLTEFVADSGRTWRGSFARWNPIASMWKTAQCSLLADSDEFSETWPRWGSMLNGVSYLRPIPALPICESASGLWQTPVADDAVNRVAGKWNSRGEPKLSAEMKLFPTPCAIDSGSGRMNTGLNPGAVPRPTFALMARKNLWPTPMANSGMGTGHPEKKQGGMNLQTAVRNWPTPCASASKGSSPASLVRKTGKSRANDRIDHAVMASDGGQLNPEWVEWLMGWPIGWTELKPLATARFREWQQQHGDYSQNEIAA